MQKPLRFRTGILLSAAIGLSLLVGFTTRGIAAPVAPDGDKVTSGHFKGHTGDTRLGSDSDQAIAGCAEKGGVAVTIGIPACLAGHEPGGPSGTIDCRPDGDDGAAPPAEEAPPAETKPAL